MNLLDLIKVKSYFTRKVSKIHAREVFVNFPSDYSFFYGIGKFIPFRFSVYHKNLAYKKWVKQSLGVCYEHASTMLLGLNKNDKCAIGILNKHENSDFYHAWCEFEYNGKNFCYEPEHDKIWDKDKFYEILEPTVLETYTLAEILEDYNQYLVPGKKYDIIDIPYDLKSNDNPIYPPEKNVQSKNDCYRGAKIKINKKTGDIVSANVLGHELA